MPQAHVGLCTPVRITEQALGSFDIPSRVRLESYPDGHQIWVCVPKEVLLVVSAQEHGACAQERFDEALAGRKDLPQLWQKALLATGPL